MSIPGHVHAQVWWAIARLVKHFIVGFWGLMIGMVLGSIMTYRMCREED